MGTSANGDGDGYRQAQGAAAAIVRGDQRHPCAGFDEFAEQCREFDVGNLGRSGVPPCVYLRMLMVRYPEGLGSECGIGWRCTDSFSLHKFPGCWLTGNPPGHSTLLKTRKRLSADAHGAVFAFVLARLRSRGC